jgi:hypothetical protein
MDSRTLTVVSTIAVAVIFFFAGFYLGSLPEDEESPPYPEKGKVLVEDQWEANSFIPPDVYSNTHYMRLKKGVTQLIIDYEIELPSATVNETWPVPVNISFYPEVVLRLRNPDNEVVWNMTFNGTIAGDFSVKPSAGAWTLRIEAKGYSLIDREGGLHDSAMVRVTAY